MAKIKSKLAEELWGSLSQGSQQIPVTARTDKFGKVILSSSTAPGPSKTPDQATWRARYAACVDEWNIMTPEQKEEYSAAAKAAEITNYNAFISACLLMPMAKLYERYATYPASLAACFGIYSQAQRFTIGNTGNNVPHKISRVEIVAYGTLAEGPVDFMIKAVDGEGEPTGPVLSSGSIDASIFPFKFLHSWHPITMTPYTLQPDTIYALVIEFLGGDPSHYIETEQSLDEPKYTGGELMIWVGDPFGWWHYPDLDIRFKIYGNPV